MPHTEIQTDDLDEFNWETITTTYRDDEITVERVETVFDNGVYRDETFYADGTARFWREWDVNNVHDWIDVFVEYDDDGNKQSRVVEYDSGVVKTELWDTDGDRIVIAEQDLSADGSAESWIDVFVEYDDDGNKQSRVVEYDSGVVKTELWDTDGDRV